MIKSVLFYGVMAVFFFTGSASGGKENSVIECLGIRDTIPVNERFDKPLEVSRGIPEPYDQSLNPEVRNRKVIPFTRVEPDTSYRGPSKIPDSYDGFKIEIMSTTAPLPGGHDIFFQHGRIVVEQLGDSKFAYLVGDFAAEKEAEAFRSVLLESRYPDSRVVAYSGGKRQSEPTQKK